MGKNNFNPENTTLKIPMPILEKDKKKISEDEMSQIQQLLKFLEGTIIRINNELNFLDKKLQYLLPEKLHTEIPLKIEIPENLCQLGIALVENIQKLESYHARLYTISLNIQI